MGNWGSHEGISQNKVGKLAFKSSRLQLPKLKSTPPTSHLLQGVKIQPVLTQPAPSLSMTSTKPWDIRSHEGMAGRAGLGLGAGGFMAKLTLQVESVLTAALTAQAAHPKWGWKKFPHPPRSFRAVLTFPGVALSQKSSPAPSGNDPLHALQLFSSCKQVILGGFPTEFRIFFPACPRFSHGYP